MLPIKVYTIFKHIDNTEPKNPKSYISKFSPRPNAENKTRHYKEQENTSIILSPNATTPNITKPQTIQNTAPC